METARQAVSLMCSRLIYRTCWLTEFPSFTFAWFACTMATGGIATLLNGQPNQFTGLKTIGEVVFVYDLVLFVAFTALISARFIMFRGTFTSALTHPTESLFIPTFFLSIVNIFDCIQAYAVPVCGPWLIVVQRVVFWIYLACTFLLATGQYTYLFTAPANRLTVQSMTPAWLLPIFPAMLTGTFASQIVKTQPAQHQATIIVAGITMQGLGWMVSFLMYAVYITRLMEYGLPAPKLRPGMFIAVGPPSFTGLALIGISTSVPTGYGVFAANPGMAEVMKELALLIAM
jgi:C4-dicarboxylate transporter/malic acid transport protein